jgi:glycosyltransferase involved in cell wall biosynthesis
MKSDTQSTALFVSNLGGGWAQRCALTLAHALAEQLGIVGDVQFPGYVDNPFSYMARSAVFVLSSAWEGLPGVLIEAMACGCPIVSTDCPGAAEILGGGVHGPLVPVGDDAALAMAVASVLDSSPKREHLAGTHNRQPLLWRVLMFQQWRQHQAAESPISRDCLRSI